MPSFSKKSEEPHFVDLEVNLVAPLDAPPASSSKALQHQPQATPNKKRTSMASLHKFAGKKLSDLIDQHVKNPSARADGAGGWANANAFEADGLTDFNGMDMSSIRTIQSIHSAVNGAIWDSPYLQEYGITGQVFVQITLNPNGDLQDQNIRVRAQNKILKVIGLRAIRQSVAQLQKKNSPSLANKVIQFKFTWTDQTNCSSKAMIKSTHLSFCRKSASQRKTFSTTEKTTTYLKALKYGFGAAEEIKKYKQQENRKKTQFNPFEQFERDPDWDLGS